MTRNAPTHDLDRLLAELNPDADLAHRHLWLLHLLAWVRAAQPSVEGAHARIVQFLDAVEADPAAQARLQAWWLRLIDAVDITTLLADFGFAPRTAMLSEATERLRYKLLPGTPETIDASELFSLAMPSAFDARWLQSLDEAVLQRIAQALNPTPVQGASHWQHALLGAITYCAGQILSTGFAPELRLRMSEEIREAQPFHALIHDAEALRVEVLHGLRTPERLDAAEQRLRERLDACRAAVGSVYAHLEDNGISVGLVFRLRQLRTRIVRVRQLLDCLRGSSPEVDTARLLAIMVNVGIDRRSLRSLLRDNSSLLAAKVAERSAETGEHYITHTRQEYLAMVRKAAGGGLVMAFTTLAKFGLYALALSAFWSGFWAGANYALSFVIVQLLHFTVATKQPAMTAPAMAAKLKDLQARDAIPEFVDEVAKLVRTQVAAILGNVLLVFPAVMGLTWLLSRALGHPLLGETTTEHTMASLHLLGPSLLFAAFTGVLLFTSSIIAGWAENWFVVRRMDSAMRYNPRITRVLGAARADRWAGFWRKNISGFAANISLGFMLGLVPAFMAFFGLGLDIRHVTLASGQLGAVAASEGLAVLHDARFWWAMASLPFIGALNVTVSFWLAFRVALRAHNVSGVDRSRIAQALRHRLRTAPLRFFLP